MKTKTYNNSDIITNATISFKLDGVRTIIKDGKAISRNNKPLYHVPTDKLEDGVYECYINNFKDTISALRTKDSPMIPKEYFYKIVGDIDPRILICKNVPTISNHKINYLLNLSINKGYEGIVLFDGKIYHKVKKIVTFDLEVIGILEGTGRNRNKLGALITSMGKVGTGFNDDERIYLWENKEHIIGKTIEVSGMEVTSNDKLRHPRFVRFRFDK